MKGCSFLTKLPPSIDNLSLLMYCFGNLANTIGKLKKLQILVLEDCFSLERLPTSIGGLTSLKRLDYGQCTSWIEVPIKVGQLCKLEALSFNYYSKLKTLCIFETKMDHLCELNLKRCHGLLTLKL